MDHLTIFERKRCMAKIKGKDTTPEMTVRKLLHRMGYRYRLHRKDLPGKPDIVFGPRKKVIFVNGCFWHKHSCRRGIREPKTNTEFWKSKREGNAERDRKNYEALKSLGWKYLIIWECTIKKKNIEGLSKKLVEFLDDCSL